jgi:hypothetical protein
MAAAVLVAPPVSLHDVLKTDTPTHTLNLHTPQMEIDAILEKGRQAAEETIEDSPSEYSQERYGNDSDYEESESHYTEDSHYEDISTLSDPGHYTYAPRRVFSSARVREDRLDIHDNVPNRPYAPSPLSAREYINSPSYHSAGDGVLAVVPASLLHEAGMHVSKTDLQQRRCPMRV